VATKAFLREVSREIETPSNVIMSDINGGKTRSLGKITNVPVHIGAGITTSSFDVCDASHFTVLLGAEWLSRTKAKICFKDRVLRYQA
jgi:hypothetical protein